jgi:hypothetical protein
MRLPCNNTDDLINPENPDTDENMTIGNDLTYTIRAEFTEFEN